MERTSPEDMLAILNAFTGQRDPDHAGDTGTTDLQSTLAVLEKLRALQKRPVDPSADGTTTRQRRIITQLERQVEHLSGHARLLACALGACPDCWGSDVDCRVCAGDGSAGFFVPDHLCFERYVVPALRHFMPARLPVRQAPPLPSRSPWGRTPTYPYPDNTGDQQ